MCNSAAEGGQRCHSHAATALTAAETRYQAVIQEGQTLMTAGQPPPPGYTAKGMQARYNLDDALARYASTPQGESDLTNRMDHHLSTLERAQGVVDPANARYHAYAQAVTEGQRLRARAKEIHTAAQTGTIKVEDAIRLSQYPSEQTLSGRVEQITAATSSTPPTPPASRPGRAPANAGYTNIGPQLASTDTLPCALCGYRPVAWIQKFRTPTGQIKYSRTCNDC